MLGLGALLRYIARALVLRRRDVLFYGAVAVLMFLGFAGIIVAERWLHHRPIVASTIAEVAKALLIAGILAGSVDLYLKRRLATEFVRDVAPFIEGIGLPPEFQDEIAFIRRIHVFRRNLRLRYRIERLDPPAQSHVRLLTTISFEVVNPTDQGQPFTLDVSCEDAYPEVGHAKFLSVGIEGPGVTGGFSYSAGRQNIEPVLTQEGAIKRFARETMITPRLGPNVAWADLESYEEENGTDTFYLSQPSVNITVQVEAPEDFEVEVFVGHRFQEGSPNRITMIPPPPERTHTWQMAAAMLTWHSITIRWKGGPESLKRAAPTEATG